MQTPDARLEGVPLDERGILQGLSNDGREQIQRLGRCDSGLAIFIHAVGRVGISLNQFE
jgi:hypothetical protein